MEFLLWLYGFAAALIVGDVLVLLAERLDR